MGYYENYVKRINRYGDTLQERIQGKREHDFTVFMNNSPNCVRARNGENTTTYRAVLQTKEYDEDETVDYLLVDLHTNIPLGTIIHTQDTRFDNERHWINYVVDPYTTAGYDRYTIVEMESQIEWVSEGVKYTSLAHAVGGGSGARDKNINLKFKTQFSEAGVYLPNKRYSVVMPFHPALKKDMKVSLGGETWRVTGFDNISIKGVSYVTLQEYLTDEIDDKPIVNYGQLKDFKIFTNLGENFVLTNEQEENIHLFFYYKDQEKFDIKYSIKPNDCYEITSQENNDITLLPTKVGPTTLTIAVGDDKNSTIEIPFIIDEQTINSISVIGPNKIPVGKTITYQILNAQNKTIKILNDSLVDKWIIYQEPILVKIKGKNMGKIILQVIDDKDKILTENVIEIQSMWLGGV